MCIWCAHQDYNIVVENVWHRHVRDIVRDDFLVFDKEVYLEGKKEFWDRIVLTDTWIE